MQFRAVPPGTGGTYRSDRIPVRGPPSTGRYIYFGRYGGIPTGIPTGIEVYRPIPRCTDRYGLV
ncbi:unnamed protein product [Musa textilis]